MKGAGGGKCALAMTINANWRASAVNLGVLRHVGALLMVDILGMSTAIQRADDDVLRTIASVQVVPKRPAPITLADQGARFISPNFRSPIAEHMGWVADHVLQMRAVGVKECERDRAMSGIRVSGCQPVRIAEQDKVLKTNITGEFHMELLCVRKDIRGSFAHRGDGVETHSSVTSSWNNGVMWAKDLGENRTKPENFIGCQWL